MKRITGAVLIAAALALSAGSVSAQSGKEGDANTGTAERTQAKPETKSAETKKKEVDYRKVETEHYTVEVPEGWEVGQETPFGQREIRPAKETEAAQGASMSSMTGPGLGRQSWQQLYNTSLYFIMRYRPNGEKMKATPYKIGKSKQNFESCSWTMTDTEGKPLQRHVILKHSNGNILALSVKIPSAAAKESKERLEAIFQHVIDTAVVR